MGFRYKNWMKSHWSLPASINSWMGNSWMVNSWMALLSFVVLLGAANVQALPFNDDMVHDQFKTSEIMRPAPDGSIPIGASERYVESKEAALALENPIPADEVSIGNGERLWDVNCSMCHGIYEDDGYKPGVVSSRVPGPDVAMDFIKAKSDGHFFSYIYFGGAVMPRYGWKFSKAEIWDMVNYIRKVQGK